MKLPAPKRLLIATHNPAKLQRYRNLLARYTWLQTLAPDDLGLHLVASETGKTAIVPGFAGNRSSLSC